MCKMAKKEMGLLIIFGAVFLFSIGGLFFQGMNFFKESGITGYAIETTVSNVTITSYLAIAMSTNLTEGILFGDISALPAADQNATHNYDGGSSGSTMYLNVSTDSNTGVDFCIKADTDLSTGSDILGAGNESYSNSTSTNVTFPAVANEVELTTGYIWAGNISVGGDIYYRFWLDVPAATPSGTYNNTITFKGVVANGGVGCS